MFLLFSTLRKYHIIISMCFIVPSAVLAGEPLTLQQSIDQVVNHNRQLLVEATRVDQAHERVKDMQGKRMPHVNVSTGWTYSNSPLQVFGSKLQQQSITATDFLPSSLSNPGYLQNYRSRLGLSLPLFAGGALLAGHKQAEYHAEAASLNFEFQKQQRIYQTIVTYMQALQFEEQLEANKQAIKAATKRWQDTKSLHSKGIVLASDVMHAHVYVLRRQVAMDETANAYQLSLEQLALLMGVNADKAFSPRAMKDESQDGNKPFAYLSHVNMGFHEPVLSQPELANHSAGLDELLSKASERRLDFQSLQQRWHASSSQRDIAYAGNLPHVSLVAGQEWNSASPALKHGNAMVGVTLSMNIFNGGSDHAKQRQAELAYNGLQWKIADQRQLIGNQIRQAWRSLELTKTKLEREQEVFQESKESLRILSLRYQQGLETTSTVLDAQVVMDDSQINIVHARSDMTIARAALLLAAGLLDEGAIQ